MYTPQQIDQISFKKATFGGYDMQQVDEFLEPLTEDYVTLYKENALLKSKMRVLVGKLEEYRKNEAGMKDAVINAQRACELKIRETEAKCSQLMANASAMAAQQVPTRNNDALIAAENARVEEAHRAANARINEIQEQMRSCIQALERIKGANPAVASPAVQQAAEPHAQDSTSVAAEIAQNVEALVGTTVDTAPKAAPRHPINDSTTSKFANLNLQFGRNYDLNGK